MNTHEGDSIDEGLQSVLCAFLRLLPRPEVSFDAREHSFGWHHVVTGDLISAGLRSRGDLWTLLLFTD